MSGDIVSSRLLFDHDQTMMNSMPQTLHHIAAENFDELRSRVPHRQRPGQGQAGSETNAQVHTSSVEMKKSVTLLHFTAVLVAATGHSYIFVTTSSITKETGSVGGALIAWLIGGLINMGMALCYAELGTMYPRAGGHYSFTMIGLGPQMGFLILWSHTVLIAGPTWALQSYAAALYIVRPAFPGCIGDQMDTAVKVLACWIMATMVAINCMDMKYVTKVQTLLTSTKLLALILIVGGGIYNIATGKTENITDPFDGTTSEPGKFAVAVFYSGFFFGGWQVMSNLLEEAKDPGRDPPRAVYISFTIIIVLYIMANIAYLTLLTPAEMMESSAVASLFIERLYSPLSILVSVFVALTSLGGLNTHIMSHSRLLYAGARNGHAPQILSMVNTKFLTPWPALFVYMAWGLVMLVTGGVMVMIEFVALFCAISSLAVVSSLLYLRWKKPDMPRPYKILTIIPVMEIIINLAILALGLYQKPRSMGTGLAIVFAGVPVYWIGVLWENKPRGFTALLDGLTAFMQKLLQLAKVKS